MTPIKHYYRILLFVIMLVLTASCSFERLAPLSLDKPISDSKSPVIEYDSETGIILQKQDDPFAINNLIEAKQALLDGAGTQTLTKAEYEEVSNTELAVTHHALTVYPKSLKEVAQIESSSGVSVSYYPFNYKIISNNVGGQITSSCESYHREKNPHEFKYKDVRTSHGEIIGDVIEELPVLFVVWPVNKEIPDSIDYRMDYDVSLPLKSFNHIHRESVRRTQGITAYTKTEEDPDDSAGYRGLAGYIRCYDDFTCSYEGVGSLSVRAQFGSYIQYSETDINGHFYLLAEIPDNASFYCVYQKAWRWSICQGNSTTPITCSFGTVQNVLGQGVQYDYNLDLHTTTNSPTNSIQRALAYYYKPFVHDITPAYFDYPIIIHSYYSQGSNSGETCFPINGNPYINIYNNTYSVYPSDYYHFEILSHEMGHITMYKDVNGRSSFYSRIKFLIESYACFVGWYLCENYYNYIGCSISDDFNQQTWNKRQEWKGSLDCLYGRYSPIYVDLMDAFNQRSYGTIYLDDSISGVPYSVIRQIMVLSTTWASCKSLLSTCGGSYYTTSQIDTYTSGIDTWFSNNPSELTSYY